MEEEETFTMASLPPSLPHPSIKHKVCWKRHELSSASSEKAKKQTLKKVQQKLVFLVQKQGIKDEKMK